jgi:hypothetical protein
MFGSDILARTLSVATRGSGRRGFQYGNSWQYHSRSDRHSKVACWGALFDLLNHCGTLRKHVREGLVAVGINHEMHDYRNNKKKNLDFVICRPGTTSRGGSKGGVRKAKNFADVAPIYGIALTPEEQHALNELPGLPMAGVANVLLATEAKAAMTEFLKARPRLHDELTSSYQTIHGDTNGAIAAGLVIVNAATSFVSPDRNKFNLETRPAEVTTHVQPDGVNNIVAGLRRLQRRSRPEDTGFDAIGIIVIDCKNDGSRVAIVKSSPSPAPTDDFEYSRFIHRLAHLYQQRFASLQ